MKTYQKNKKIIIKTSIFAWEHFVITENELNRVEDLTRFLNLLFH